MAAVHLKSHRPAPAERRRLPPLPGRVEVEGQLPLLSLIHISPAALSAALVRERGFGEMPKEGWLPTMVPGAPGGWAELNRRFGTRPLEELFAPAASYAREGVCLLYTSRCV